MVRRSESGGADSPFEDAGSMFAKPKAVDASAAASGAQQAASKHGNHMGVDDLERGTLTVATDDEEGVPLQSIDKYVARRSKSRKAKRKAQHTQRDGGGQQTPSPPGQGDAGGSPSPSGVDDLGAAPRATPEPSHVAWKVLMYVLVIGPWKAVRGLAWVLGRWQALVRPGSEAMYLARDRLDKHAPSVHDVVMWAWNTVSLLLHFSSVFLTFVIIHGMYGNGHSGLGGALLLVYLLSHYLMAVTMYMENDRIRGEGRYDGHEILTFAERVVEVAFWDLQMAASLLHSNCMLAGLSQMRLKGYEEARVCLHALVCTVPLVALVATIYDGLELQWIDWDELHKTSFEERLWGTILVSALNFLEKWVRCSLADPWLHPSNDDGYPLMYMRANAARLPRGFMAEWLFRCNLQLSQQRDELVLRDVFSIYTFNCKGDARELCDGHKAYLLRKALRAFNGATTATTKLHTAETVVQRLMRSQFRDLRSIRALDGSHIRPGHLMAEMLAQVLGDTIGYHALNLDSNGLGDAAASRIADALRLNRGLSLRVLLLSNNAVGEQGCRAVARLVADSRALNQLSLAGNPLGDAGARVLFEAISTSKSLAKLDLTSTGLGPDSGAPLGNLLKGNTCLRELRLRGCALGGSGVEALARGLRSNTSLTQLDLGSTGADDRGATALAHALTSNHGLTALDLTSTTIGDTGARALCEAMRQNTTLQVCDLSNTAADRSWTTLMSNIVSERPRARAAQ